MNPAYGHAEGLAYELRIGTRRPRKRQLPKSDQFAPELLYFSDCILRNREPEPSGAEGLADVRVIEALQRSIETAKAVAIEAPRQRLPRPTLHASPP